MKNIKNVSLNLKDSETVKMILSFMFQNQAMFQKKKVDISRSFDLKGIKEEDGKRKISLKP